MLTVTYLVVIVVVTAGCVGGAAAGRSPAPDTSLQEHATVDTTPVTNVTALTCGTPFQRPADGALTLTGRFPTTVRATDGVVAGTVEVTSHGAGRGIIAPGADVFLVQDGRLTTVPMAQDAMGVRLELAPGTTKRLPANGTLVSCDPSGRPLAAGRYELYTRVVLLADDGPNGESFGGPWPLEVR
jgi:hypothetical protein